MSGKPCPRATGDSPGAIVADHKPRRCLGSRLKHPDYGIGIGRPGLDAKSSTASMPIALAAACHSRKCRSSSGLSALNDWEVSDRVACSIEVSTSSNQAE